MNDGATRGIVLVVVAALVGIVLLASGLDDSGPVTVRADDGDEAATDSDDTSDTTDTVPAADDIDRLSIPIVVANGGDVEGAAGAVTELLTSLGYNPGPAVDVTAEAGDIGLDTVFYLTEPTNFEAQAQIVADDLGLGPEAVLPMPVPPPAEIGLAAVLVVLGSQGTLAADTVAGATTATTATTVPAG